jgi:hypothetical protein
LSSVPENIPGVGEVYRHQGRANFPHQIEEADRAITERCASLGGRPVIVSRKMIDLGMLSFSSGQANTSASVIGRPYSAVATGTTAASSSSSSMRNFDQDILFKCEKNQSH